MSIIMEGGSKAPNTYWVYCSHLQQANATSGNRRYADSVFLSYIVMSSKKIWLFEQCSVKCLIVYLQRVKSQQKELELKYGRAFYSIQCK